MTMEKPRKKTSNILYNDGWNACHDAMSTWLEGEVPTEKEILEHLNNLPNYEDKIPEEMWVKIKKAVSQKDDDFFRLLMQASVKLTHKECAQAVHKFLTRKLTGKV